MRLLSIDSLFLLYPSAYSCIFAFFLMDKPTLGQAILARWRLPHISLKRFQKFSPRVDMPCGTVLSNGALLLC